jgi:hypothetical protein
MLIVFLLLSVISLHAVRRTKGSKLPLIVYCIAYGLTTVIGATIISVQHGGLLWALYGGGLDTSVLTDYDSLSYDFLLFAPFIIVPFTIIFVSRLRTGYVSSVVNRFVTAHDVDSYSYIFVLVLFSGYCFFTLYRFGYLSLNNVLHLEGDFVGAMELRSEIFARLGRVFFGLLYTGLPTLTQIALYKAFKTGEWKWRYCFFSVVFMTVFLVLLTAQKSPLFVYFLSLVLGYVVLKGTKPWLLIAAGGGGFLLLNLIQGFVLGAWQAIQGFYLIIFRTANSFPYYLNIYPSVVPYRGIDIALDLIGLSARPDQPETVFNFMYPTVTWVQGTSPAPAHVAAYSQAGMWFAVVTLVFIGWYLHFLSELRTTRDSVFGYALFVEGLIAAYYLTQITVRDVLLTGYGLVWVAIPIVLLVGTCKILNAAIANVRDERNRLGLRNIAS